MPKEHVLFRLSYEDREDGQRYYNIIYDYQADDNNGTSQLVGAMYKTLKEFPNLVEQMALMTEQAINELSEPLTSILNEKP